MDNGQPRVFVSDEVAAVRRLHQDLLSLESRQRPIREQLELQAQRILEAFKAGDRAAVTHIQCWHPDLVGLAPDDILNHEFTLSDALETIAREYGFRDWQDAFDHGVLPPNQEFESAVDAMLVGDVDALKEQLIRQPALVRERSSFGHCAMLLHYVGSNGVETHRQVVPANLAAVTRVLIDAGADVNAVANIYSGSTTIALLITSSHPAEAGVVDEVVDVLVQAGAETD